MFATRSISLFKLELECFPRVNLTFAGSLRRPSPGSVYTMPHQLSAETRLLECVQG